MLIKGETPPAKTCRVQLYFTEKEYEMFEKAVRLNGASRVGRALVDKEPAVMAMIRTVFGE